MESHADEQAIESGEQGYLFDLPASTRLEGLKILEALSNEDAINLFFYTKERQVTSKEAMEALGLTQKRFYTRLKLLLDAGLLEKREEGYRHTFLGTLVEELGLSLLKIVENKEKIEILNSIRKTSGTLPENTSQIASALSIELPTLYMKDIKIISSFEEFVSSTCDIVKDTKKSIHMATQYLDSRVVEASINIMNKGIEVKAIIDKIDQFNDALKLTFSLFRNPALIKSFYSFLKDPTTQLRLSNIPYTFMIIDKEQSMIEIKNMITGEFIFAIHIINNNISTKLDSFFESLWEASIDLKDKIKI